MKESHALTCPSEWYAASQPASQEQSRNETFLSVMDYRCFLPYQVVILCISTPVITQWWFIKIAFFLQHAAQKVLNLVPLFHAPPNQFRICVVFLQHALNLHSKQKRTFSILLFFLFILSFPMVVFSHISRLKGTVREKDDGHHDLIPPLGAVRQGSSVNGKNREHSKKDPCKGAANILLEAVLKWTKNRNLWNGSHVGHLFVRIFVLFPRRWTWGVSSESKFRNFFFSLIDF